MKLLVTGGAGFIGSAFVRLLLGSAGSPLVINLDKLTYAGNLENLEAVAGHAKYRFVHGDICAAALVDALLSEEKPDVMVRFAASRTWIAASTLFEAARAHQVPRPVHISTDEVAAMSICVARIPTI